MNKKYIKQIYDKVLHTHTLDMNVNTLIKTLFKYVKKHINFIQFKI